MKKIKIEENSISNNIDLKEIQVWVEGSNIASSGSITTTFSGSITNGMLAHYKFENNGDDSSEFNNTLTQKSGGLT